LIQYMASVVVFELHRTCSRSLSGCIGHVFLLVLLLAATCCAGCCMLKKRKRKNWISHEKMHRVQADPDEIYHSDVAYSFNFVGPKKRQRG
jgi:hypothetical protein